jgi:predicted HTH domain antitoxin
VTEIVVQVPEETALVLCVSPEELGYRVQMAAAAELFELGQLSSGAAARLAGVPCTVFLSQLADYGVDTFRLTQDELLKETRLVRGHLQHVAVAVFASDRAIAYPTCTD